MKKQIKKSGQKIINRLSRTGRKVSELSKSHIKEHLIGRVENAKTVRLWILEWVLLAAVIILFAIIQTIWYHHSYETKAFARGGTYIEATLGQVNSMNPLYANTSSEKTLARLLFAGLLSTDVSGQLGNDLAQSVTVDEAGTTWTVKLRPDLKWSDGQPITSDDIVFTFNLINNASAKTTVSTGFANTKIELVDELTIKFILPTIYVAFYDALDFPIIPAHILSEVDPALIYEHDFSTQPITSGPFILNAVQPSASGTTIYLNKSTDYHRGEPMLGSFVVKTYDTTDDIANALNRLEVTASADLTNSVNPKITNSAIYNKKTATNNGAFAFLNTMSPALSQVKVRQAIRAGLDIEELRDDLVGDIALDYPILDQQISLQFPELPAHSIDTTLRLLADSGYTYTNGKLLNSDGIQPTLNLAAPTISNLPELATRLETQLIALGFAVNLNIYEVKNSAQSFFASVIRPRDYDILLYEIDMGIDPDLFPYYHSSQAVAAGFNFSNYKSGIVDDLLLSARTTFDASLRKAKYQSFLDYWVSDVPAIGLYRVNLSYYFNHTARTFSENSSLSSSLDRFSDVLYWATDKTTRYRTP